MHSTSFNLAAFVLMLSPLVGVEANDSIRADELAASCLVTCQVLDGKTTGVDDLAKNDFCVGYLKSLAGSIELFNKSNKNRIETGFCTKKLLANRTAKQPSDDQLIIQACAVGRWLSDRPSSSNRNGAQAVINWMEVTQCH